MSDYSVSEAKASLSRLIREAEAGQEVRVTRRGLPVAVLLSTQKYDELKAGRPSFTERYQAFRQELELDAVELEPNEIFAGGRDKSPGREFAWCRFANR